MENNKNKKESSYASLTGVHRAVPVILVALSVFILICFITQNTGAMGRAISGFLLGCFSVGGYFIPVLLLLHAYFYATDLKNTKTLVSRVICSFILVATIAMLCHAITNFGEDVAYSAKALYDAGKNSVGGGFIGGTFAFLIIKLIDYVGLIILTLTIFALYVVYFLAGKNNSVRQAIGKLLYVIVEFCAKIEAKIKGKIKENKKAKDDLKAKKEAKRIEALKEKEEKLYDDDFFAADNGLKQLKIDPLRINETRSREQIEQNPTLQEKVRPRAQVGIDQEDCDAPEEERPSQNSAEPKRKSPEKKKLYTDYAFDANGDIIMKEPVADRTMSSEDARIMENISDRADNIFTEDFDPYSLADSERLANKPSSRSEYAPADEGVTELKTPESPRRIFSEKEIEEARRRAQFELRKEALIKEVKAREAAKAAAERDFLRGEEIAIGNPNAAPRPTAEPIYAQPTQTPAQNSNFYTPYAAEPQPTNYTAPSAQAPAYTAPSAQTPVYTTLNPGTPSYDYTAEANGAGIIVPPPHVLENTRLERTPAQTATEPQPVKSDEVNGYYGIQNEAPREEPSYTRISGYYPGEEKKATEAPVRAEAPREFKAFSTPSPSEYRSMPSEAPRDELKVTRTLMTEAPSEPETEPDETLCVFSDNRNATYEFEDSEEKHGAVFEFDDPDEDDDVEISIETEEIPDEDVAEDVEIPVEKQNPDVLKYRDLYSVLSKPEQESKTEDEPNDADEPSLTENEEASAEILPADESAEEIEEPNSEFSEEIEEDEEDGDVPFDDYMPIHTPSLPEPKKAPEKAPAEKPDYSSFQFPPIDLLAKGKDSDDPTIELEIQENGEKLIDALAQFNVRASVRSVDRGPRITRYEIVPARGVRVNSVISLFDDIALNLAAEGIRMEAPIPGKSAIGVEIPNKHPTTVLLRDLLETEEFKNETSKTFSCVGKDVTGNPVFGDMSKMPHILVAGATGMGKSVCINSILISILYKARPDEVKFIMIDPKTVEFTMYNGIPHLLVPVVTDVKQAAGALMWAIDEMNRRYELMAKHEVRKLDSYNEIVKADPSLGEPLPKIIIVIDELNDLMQQVRKPVEGLITNITQKARAAGIHMIIGTQRPSVDVITGVIKANVPSRISCKVTSFNDSKTILDQAGAEKLLDKGDMLYAPVGKPKPVRVQGAFVSDGEVEKIMKFLKSNVKGAIYDAQAMEDITKAAQKCSKGKDSGIDDDFDTEAGSEEGVGYLNDKQFLEAADLAIKQGKISTSLIQRKIGVGYGKAAKFIDIMEELGIVSEPNGQKPRDVLVTRDEWQEMRNRRSLDD